MSSKNNSQNPGVGDKAHVSLVELIALLAQFSSVERRNYRGGSGRPENNVEHSYDLAMAAWVIVKRGNLPLELEKVLKYALVHDLVELYAGDTFALDDNDVATKEQREHAAISTIAQTHSISHFSKDIEEYEQRATEEAKFVYALDKIMPVLQIISGQQHVWRDYGVTRQIWTKKFASKIQSSEYLKPYYAQLEKLLDQNSHLFVEEVQ